MWKRKKTIVVWALWMEFLWLRKQYHINATIIQSQWRARQDRVIVKYLREQKAALCIQVSWRARQARLLLARKKYLVEKGACQECKNDIWSWYCFECACATNIQGCKLCNECHNLIHNLAVLKKHKVIRRVRFERWASASTRIQAWWRKILARRNFSSLKQNRREAAASFIQKFYRQSVYHRKQILLERERLDKAERLAMIHASKVIQFGVRRWLSNKHEIKRVEMVYRAACVVQRAVRCWLARLEFYKRKRTQKEHISAILLQKRVRGFLERKRIYELRNEEKKKAFKAATIIQSKFRSYMANMALEKKRREKKERDSVIIIQCSWRVKKARLQVERKRMAREDMLSQVFFIVVVVNIHYEMF